MVAMSTVGWFACWDETLPIGKLAHEPENPPRLSGKHGLVEDLRARSLESASPGKQARVDRRESDLVDQGGDPALRTPVVTGKETTNRRSEGVERLPSDRSVSGWIVLN